jgi:hypothetical protein
MSYPAPILNLNPAGSKQLHPAVSYSRASLGSYTNRNGDMRYANVGVPRFEHNPLTGICDGLSLETSTTFLDTYSEQFDNAVWMKTNLTVTTNADVAPDGATAFDKLTETASSGYHVTYRSFSFTSGTAITCYVFAKAFERSKFRLELPSSVFGATQHVSFDLTTKQVSTVSGAAVGNLFDCGNGKFLCSVTATPTTTASGSVGIYLETSDGIYYSGVTDFGLCVWGFKFYAGTGTTSYLPTTTTGVTRAKDVFYVDLSLLKDISGNSLWTGLEGTVVMRFKANSFPSTTPVFFLLGDGTWSNYMLAFQQPTQAPFQSTTGGVNSYVYPRAVAPGVDTVFRMRFNKNGFSVANDSQAILSKTCALPPGMKVLWIGNVDTGSNGVNMTLKSLQVYNRYINDSDFVAL